MHGVGSNEQNMFSFANALPDNFLVVSARGPLTLRENSYAWFQVHSRQKVLSSMKNRQKIPEKKF